MGEISDPSNDDGNGDDKVRSTFIVAFFYFSFVFSNYAFPPFGQSDEDRADELQANTTTPHRFVCLFILSPANSHGKGMHSSIRTISRSSDDPTDDHRAKQSLGESAHYAGSKVITLLRNKHNCLINFLEDQQDGFLLRLLIS